MSGTEALLVAVMGVVIATSIIAILKMTARNILRTRWAEEWTMIGRLLRALEYGGDTYIKLAETPAGSRAERKLLSECSQELRAGRFGRLWREIWSWRFKFMLTLSPSLGKD